MKWLIEKSRNLTMVSIFGLLAGAAASIYPGAHEVPERITVKDLTELKAKFTFVIVPVMAVKFVQKILKYDHAPDVVY